VRVIHFEENLLDVELVRITLAAEGLDYDWVQVRTQGDFAAALSDESVELILAEYLLTDFNGIAALALARKYRPSVPFIFVSASLDEAVALEAVKSGASDYVSKYRLSKLGPAVRRAVSRTVSCGRTRSAGS
jgi:DNA-binding NtrC family response regulator